MEHSRLPLDVYLEIIDAVTLDPDRNSGATLAACALTARSWLPRARFGLYSKVVLRGNKQCLAFSQALLDCSALGPLVQDLMLFSVWARWDRDSPDDQYDPFPLQAVHTLSNLKNMTFEFDGGEVVPPNPIFPFLREVASRPSLRTLGLGSFTFHSVDDLVEILAAGPHLTSVVVAAFIFNCEFSEGNSRADFAPDYCRDLRTVVFTDNEKMDPLLRALPFPSNITKLTLGPPWRETDPGLQQYYEGVTLNDFLDLPHFVKVENLVLLVVDTGAWVASALAMVRSPALQMLSLFCWCEELDSHWGSVLQDLDLPLREIDTMLSKAPFLGLRRIRVTVFCREDELSSRSNDGSSGEAEDSAGDSPKDPEQDSVSDDQTETTSSSRSEREDAADGSAQENLWFEQQVRESMPSCHEREILEVHAKIGSWSPIPYIIEPRIIEYPQEARQALHLDPSN